MNRVVFPSWIFRVSDMNAIRKSLASLLVIVSVPLSATAEDKLDFVTEIKPILTTHCLTCHGPDEQEGEYRLDRKADALRGGARGTAIVPGKSKTSNQKRFTSISSIVRDLDPRSTVRVDPMCFKPALLVHRLRACPWEGFTARI